MLMDPAWHALTSSVLDAKTIISNVRDADLAMDWTPKAIVNHAWILTSFRVVLVNLMNVFLVLLCKECLKKYVWNVYLKTVLSVITALINARNACPDSH